MCKHLLCVNAEFLKSYMYSFIKLLRADCELNVQTDSLRGCHIIQSSFFSNLSNAINGLKTKITVNPSKY